MWQVSGMLERQPRGGTLAPSGSSTSLQASAVPDGLAARLGDDGGPWLGSAGRGKATTSSTLSCAPNQAIGLDGSA